MEKIVIIEDEPELAYNIKEILVLIGYEVAGILDNGKDALEFLHNNPVDLIFMDIQIRGPIDGVELCKKIKTRFKIPVIYLTAFSNKSILDKITATEYEGYILKPFSIEVLQAITYLVLKNFPKTPRHSPNKNVMMVRDKGNSIPLQFGEILFLKADGLYTRIQTKTKSFVSRNILKDMIQGLPKNIFVRVHKSYTINYKEITSFNAKEVQIGEYSIPLRRGSLKEIKALIEFQSPDF